MKKLSTLLKLVAIVLFMGAWHTTTWAQDALQLTAAAPQLTQDFDGMWDGQQATLDMPQGWRIGGILFPAVCPVIARWVVCPPRWMAVPDASM